MFVARAATDGQPTIGSIGATLGFSNFRNAGSVGSAIGYKQTNGDPDVGGMAFLTQPSASIGPLLETMTLSHGGLLGLGDDSPSAKMDILGGVQKKLGGSVSVSSGSTAVVGTSTNFTSIFKVGDSIKIADEIFSVAAVSDDTNLTLDSNHSAGASGVSYFGDYDYLNIRKADGTGVLKVNSHGWIGMGTDSPASELEVAGTITAGQFNGPIASSTVSTTGGSASAPGYSFSGDSNTGLFSSSPDTIEVTVGGSNIFDLSSAGLISSISGGGVVSSANGSATTPTFSFAGDTDTGWYRAGADTLAAATAGSERVRIDSSGNVGIGTVSPSTPLHIKKTTTMGAIGTFDTTQAIFRTDEGAGTYISFDGNSIVAEDQLLFGTVANK